MSGAGGVACIVPAYNEAARIGRVLAAVAGHPLVGEVIVVDDGSTDATVAVAGAVAGVRVVALERNGGKTRALREGLLRVEAPTVLLLDADLVGLEAGDVTALLGPVLEGRADVAISLRANAPRAWRLIGLDYISGERVLPMALLRPHLNALGDLPKFGFEVWLNRLCIREGCRIAVVPWPGVASPWKSAKLGVLRGVRADAAMMRDIFGTVSPLEAARQIRAMRRLRIARGPGSNDPDTAGDERP